MCTSYNTGVHVPTVSKFAIPGYSRLSFVMYELFLFQNKMMVIIDVYPQNIHFYKD